MKPDLFKLSIEELEELLAGTTGTAKIDLLNQLSIKIVNSDKARSLQLAQQAAVEAPILGYWPGKAKALLTIGSNHEKDFNKALAGIKEALSIFKELNVKPEVASALRNLSMLYRRISDLDSAEACARELIAWCEEHDLQDKLGGAYSMLATNLITKGQYAPALQVMQKALSILELRNEPAEIAMASSNLCALYFNLENTEKALEYANKTAANYKLANLPQPYADSLLILGQVYGKMNKQDESLASFEAALELAEEMGYKELEAEIFPNLGSLYLQRHKYQAAETYLNKGLELCEKFNLVQPHVFALLTLGNLFKAEDFNGKDYERAESFYLQGLGIAEKNGLLWEAREIYQALCTLNETMAKWEAAYKFQKRYVQLDKEISNHESHNKIASFEAEKELAITVREKEVTDRILHNILPRQIADRIRKGDEDIIERYESVTVLFADIVGFTNWSKGMPVHELAKHLNRLFQMFDELANTYDVEKIKTIGDAYMCVAGLPEPCANHAERMAAMALAMNEKITEAYPTGEIRLRIGLHSGEVVAGVLGKNKYVYDLWGDTVNTASRMESHGMPEKIQVTEEVKQLLQHKFEFEEREVIEVKGKGKMKVYFLKG